MTGIERRCRECHRQEGRKQKPLDNSCHAII
nr:MAG TPA: cytochrome c-552 [Caudoviricetes sp.]